MDDHDLFNLLPTKDNEEDEIERKNLWKRIDMNGNGKLSLSEINSTFTNLKGYKILT